MSFTESDLDTYYERCLMCGEFIDYCLGHEEADDVDGLYEMHENGDHSACNPLACDDAPVLTD